MAKYGEGGQVNRTEVKIMKKKVISAIIAGTIVLSTVMPAMPVKAVPQVSEETQALQGEYEKLEAKTAELNEQVQKLDAQINPLARKIDDNNKEIDKINQEVENTNKEIEHAKEDISKQEELLGERLRELYKSGGQTSYISLIFSADSFGDLMSRIDSAGRLINLDKKVVKELLDEKEKLDEKITSLDTKKKEIVKINEDTEKQKSELDKKRAEQQSILNEAVSAQKEFDSKFLSEKERFLVKDDISTINNSASTKDQLILARTALVEMKKNQLKSPTIIGEVKTAIDKADKLIKQKQREEEAEANRGSGTTVTGEASAVIAEAYKHLGKAYVYGASGPSNFDCSGFTSYVYKKATGIYIGRDTGAQIGAGREVSQSQLQPGDLVFPHSGHVGIYIGNGKMIHSPQTGDVVKVAPVYKFWRARRILN